MSRSVFVGFRDKGFWAYDVVSSVFLGFVIDAAERSAVSNNRWLAEAIQHWRVNVEVSDYGLYLDDKWSESQIGTVVALCRCSSEAIRARGNMPVCDIQSILPDVAFRTRGHDPIPGEPVARFGEALIALLQGNLAEAPPGNWWFYTLADEVDLIAKQTAV